MEKFIDRNSLKSSDKKEGDLAYFAGITHCGILAQATIALPYVNQSKIRKIKDVVSGAIVLATADVAQVQEDKKGSSQENSFTHVLRISKIEICSYVTKNPLDSGIEGVEVMHDLESTIRLIVQCTNVVKEGLDIFADHTWPRVQIETEPITQAYVGLKNRGIRIRFITEITAENISYCKEVMKFAEVRHLDGIMAGGWGVSERDYIAPIPSSKGEPVTGCIHSNVKEVVALQQYIINSLWSKAIPAKQRIKEIEQGAKREFIEVIRDPREIQKIGYDLIKGAEEEILILFSSENIFRSQGISEVFESLSIAASQPRNVKIRILVPARESEAASKFKELGIDTRQRKQQQEPRFQNKLTTLIVDQSYCLTVELKGDSKETFFDEAMGLATYSNSEPTVLASLAIFEQIWMQSEKHKDEERREATVS